MNIVIVGLSHKTAPVEIREIVAFPTTAMEAPLQQMLELPSVTEAVIVSTCNRVELYAISRQPVAAVLEMKQFMASFHNLEMETLQDHLYHFEGKDAIQHVLRVAASLDSMMGGDHRILVKSRPPMAMPGNIKLSA